MPPVERAFRKGHIEIDFPVPPFDSIGALLLRATRLFFATLPFLAGITLGVLFPAKLLLQLICSLADLPGESMASYFLLDLGGFLFTALVTPAVIYGLVYRFIKT